MKVFYCEKLRIFRHLSNKNVNVQLLLQSFLTYKRFRRFSFFTPISMILLLLVMYGVPCSAQVTKLQSAENRQAENKELLFTTDKIANTLVSTIAVRGLWHTPFGNLRLDEQYRATSIISTNAATRDDQALLLEHSFALDTSFSLLSRGFVFLTQDSRDIGLSSLQRYSFISGIRWQPEQYAELTVLGGIENNIQLGIEATGSVASVEAKIADLDWEDYTLTGSSVLDIRQLDARRTNSDFSNQFSMISLGDSRQNSLQIQGYYRRLGRDFFTFVNAEQTREVEQRLENRYGINGQIRTVLHKSLSAAVEYTLEQGTIDRRYAGRVPGTLQTYVNRGLEELQLQITASLLYATSLGDYKIGMHYFSRNERNDIERVFDINVVDEIALRTQEQQRDNTAQRVRLFGNATIGVSKSDTFYINGLYSLLRYDTPSMLNFDDRDELQAITEMRYKRSVSSALTFDITARAQVLHLVFIKQQRSSLNNWNRIFTLSPSISIRTKRFTAHPRFEVLANYTVYDYEQQAAETRSFSFRQISLRDSIQINLSDDYLLEARLYGRHFERGRLYWTDFAETPISSNDEYFIKLLAFRRNISQWSVGVGARYYALIQKSLILTPNIGISGDAVQRFYGPEVQCDYRLGGGSTVVLNGWYERQTVNGVAIRYVPNLFLHTSILL